MILVYITALFIVCSVVQFACLLRLRQQRDYCREERDMWMAGYKRLLKGGDAK